jgi:hypothetical protein
VTATALHRLAPPNCRTGFRQAPRRPPARGCTAPPRPPQAWKPSTAPGCTSPPRLRIRRFGASCCSRDRRSGRRPRARGSQTVRRPSPSHARPSRGGLGGGGSNHRRTRRTSVATAAWPVGAIDFPSKRQTIGSRGFTCFSPLARAGLDGGPSRSLGQGGGHMGLSTDVHAALGTPRRNGSSTRQPG